MRYFSLLKVILAKACRVLPCVFAKSVRKIKRIRISAKLGYLSNTVICVHQKMLRVTQTKMYKILRRSGIKLLLELPYKRGMT